MDYFTLVATLVGQLAIISKDSNLSPRGQAINETLALLSTIIGKGELARAELEMLALQVSQMVTENREPTQSEWQSLRDLSRQYHQTLNPSSV